VASLVTRLALSAAEVALTGDEHTEPVRLEDPASGICRKLLVCD
jgi:hypothetical protein